MQGSPQLDILLSNTEDKSSLIELITMKEQNLTQPLPINPSGAPSTQSNYTIKHSPYCNIPYFTYGNTINFYLPIFSYSNGHFNYPPFAFGKQIKKFIAVLVIALLIFPFIFRFMCIFFNNSLIIFGEASLFLLLLFSLIYTFIINPGTVYYSDDLPYNQNDFNYCEICKVYTHKKKKVLHCKTCGVCCEKREHHCWVFGKCIGKGNNITFYLTVGSTIMFMGSMYWIIVYFFRSIIK